VASVTEYRWSRSRFQVSKLGGRVHRQVEEVLHAGKVREIARELLGSSVATLHRPRLRTWRPGTSNSSIRPMTLATTGHAQFGPARAA
jgi:hypothetical protein